MVSHNVLGSGFLQATPKSRMDRMHVDERYKLNEVLARKLQNVPRGTMPLPRKPKPKDFPKNITWDELTVTHVVEHQSEAMNLPHIPSDIRLEFMLANRAAIDEQGRLAIKDAETQHLDITRAIFFWRFDELHQFQRYHDNARWNIALFVALLTDERSESPEAKHARDFAVTYLAAVLEHHNDPTSFEARESFVKIWKYSKYDFFTFSASQKALLKKEMKRLTKEWNDELDRIKNGKELGKNKKEIEAAYNAKIAKFVGIIIPGRVNQRGPNYRAPDTKIQELRAENALSIVRSPDPLQEDALLEALSTRADDYFILDEEEEKEKRLLYVQQMPTQSVLGHEEIGAQHLRDQHPKAKQAALPNYPALHFPKVSRFDVNKDADPIVDKSGAIAALRKNKPKAILVKLMQVFPEEVPPPQPATLAPEAEVEKVVDGKAAADAEPTFDLKAWKASVNQRQARHPAANSLTDAGPPPEPASTEHRPPQLDQYIMDVDDSVLQTETT